MEYQLENKMCYFCPTTLVSGNICPKHLREFELEYHQLKKQYSIFVWEMMHPRLKWADVDKWRRNLRRKML